MVVMAAAAAAAADPNKCESRPKCNFPARDEGGISLWSVLRSWPDDDLS